MLKGKWYRLDKRYLAVYIKLLIISMLYIFPIMLVNVYYNDDMARSIYGVTGWNGDGRPLGEFLIKLLSGGEPIIDMAPLTLILSVVILSYALTIYAKSHLDYISCDCIQVMLLAAVLMNPFAMSNLTYRFDCIIMYIALSISILLFSMPETMGKIKTVGYAFVLSTAVMSLYQPAIGMCIVLFIIHFFFVLLNKKTALDGICKIGGVGMGAIFYKLFISRYFISTIDWRFAASDTVDISFQGIQKVISNMIEYIRYVKNFFMQTSSFNQIVWGTIIVLAIITMLFEYLRLNDTAIWHKILGASFIVLSPAFVLIATFLPLTFLENLSLKSRVFISFGGFLIFIGIMLSYANRKRHYITWLIALCLFYQLIYMYSYANALKSQNEYEQYMVYSIVHDVETINGDGEFSEISFIGQIPRSRQLAMLCNKFPFFYEIVPVYFGNDSWIGGAWVYHYMQYDLTITAMNEADQEAVDTTCALMENARYSCYANNNKIIIYFH